MAKITLNYLTNKIFCKILPLINLEIKKVYIFAPQRTFSNYFENFLQENFIINLQNSSNEIKKYDNPFHKHMFKPNIKALKKQKNSIIFILYKKFDLWHASLVKNDQDFFDQFLVYHKKKILRNDYKKLKEYHKNWYNDWLKIRNKLNNIELIHQDQTLTLNNNKRLFYYLKKKYSLISKGKMNIPKKIPRSNNFSNPLKGNKILNESKSKSDNYFKKFFKII